MDEPTKVQENYYRRWAKRLGYVLNKSRARQWSINNQREYTLIDDRNIIALGSNFDARLDQVADFLKEKEQELRNE